MKRAALLLCCTLCCTLFLSMIAVPVYAHPGGTDEDGGHTNRSTGEYHYHHGYSAHDHYDMDGDGDLDCPFDFDNQTGINSGSDSERQSSPLMGRDGNKSQTMKAQPRTSSTKENEKNSINTSEDLSTEYHLSLENMIESLFLLILTLFFGLPFFATLYSFACIILRLPVSWLLKLLCRNHSDNSKDKYSTFISNVILLVILYICFLQPITNSLIQAPDMLASVIIIIGIIIFIGVWQLFKSFSDKDKLYSTINDLKKERSDIEQQLQESNSQNLNLKRKNAYLETQQIKINEEVNRLQSANIELWKSLDELDSNIQCRDSNSNASTKVANDSMPLIIPKEIYLINNRIPVKGKITDRKPYGDYTAYVSAKGRCYHSHCYCGSNYLHAVHIFEVYGKKQRCLRCIDALPDGLPEWYTLKPDYFFDKTM